MIYFIQDAGTLAVKIGYALNDVDRRRDTLQTGNSSELIVLASLPGERCDEAALHRRFAAHRVAGEWFRPHPDILAFALEAATSQRVKGVLAEVGATGALKDPPWTIYLAGKITGRGATWRNRIVACEGDGITFNWSGLSERNADSWDVAERAISGKHHLSGPFLSLAFCREDHGYVSVADGQSQRWHGTFHTEERATDANDPHFQMRRFEVQPRSRIAELCRAAIRRSDVVFAWVDGADCHATFTEVGYAAALGKRVVLACPQAEPELWFLRESADVYIDGIEQPDEALFVGMGVLYGGAAAARDMLGQYDGCGVTIQAGGLLTGVG